MEDVTSINYTKQLYWDHCGINGILLYPWALRFTSVTDLGIFGL